MSTQSSTKQTGIIVSPAITASPGSGAGGVWLNHAEGIVVSTAIVAGGIQFNHAEGLVGSAPVAPAGIVVSTGVVAGSKKIFIGGLS